MTYAIETHGLTRCFGDLRAVDGLDLEVRTGCFYGFLGPNGAGKSTTIKMLTGLLAPTSGTMRVLDQDLSDDHAAIEIRRRIGVVPEDLALFDNLSAREYLTFIGRMYRLPPQTIQDRSQQLLSMMDLDQEDRKLCVEFSHGMKKKLSLAAALMPNPDVLFLDEPFEGVDAVSSRVLKDTLRRCVERGATVFLTSTSWRSWRSSAPTWGSSPRAGSCIRPAWTMSDRPAPWRPCSSRPWAVRTRLIARP